MARMRSLKPEFWSDEELACQLTRDERMLYLGMWNLADEHSRLRGDPRYIKGQLFPYDDDITPHDIEKMLGNLAALGKVHQYSVGVGRYLFLPNLSKHQRLETDKVPSRLPGPDEDESGANKNARDPDEPAPDPDELSLKHVAGGREHVAGGRGSRAGAREAPPKSILANGLLEEHTSQITPTPPRPVTQRTGEQIDLLLDDSKITPDEIRAGLALLRSKSNLGPGALPSLVHQVRLERANPDLAAHTSSGRRNFRGGAADPLTDQKYGPGSTDI